MQGITKSLELADGRILSLETGRLAKQADGAVMARLGDTMVLCTAVVDTRLREGLGFFPLTVDYREKYSAGGKIPGGFIKREGRPTDKEVLSSRLVDRCIRPLFPDGFFHEVQVMLNVVSADGENDADVLAGVGASAALMLGGSPFGGPVGEVRIGRVDGEFILFPTKSELAVSDFNLIVAGTENAIVMVEGELHEVSEEDMIAAFEFAHAGIREICALQHELIDAAGGPADRTWTIRALPEGLLPRVEELVAGDLDRHIREPYEKARFYNGIDEIKTKAVAALLGSEGPDGDVVLAESTPDGWTADQIRQAVSEVESRVMRRMIVHDKTRLDGRDHTSIRPIWGEVGYLPRAHGSAIFTRGETQTLTSVTLGGTRDVQAVDQVFDTQDRRFYLHYNFPSFSVGEVRPIRGPGRREIGHGYLAERGLSYTLPKSDEFPYAIRIVSDVLESNGSSSMATVCAGSLALMDAGVPVRRAVSGIAMGLIVEDGETAILSDILGTEDHLGDMDFKVTGTREGITACQMDIKISGLSMDLMARALHQAREGRHHILSKMEEILAEPREDLSPYAPRLVTIEISPEFIGALIGPGGKVIQGMQRETETKIDIEERDGKGYVTIASADQEKMQMAISMVKQIVTVPEVGSVYQGKVVSIQPFGAIIEVLPGKEGLLHVSEIDYGYVDRVEDYFQMGDTVQVQLIEIRDDGKLRLSRKPFLEKPAEGEERRRPPESREGRDDRRSGDGRHGRGGYGGGDSGRRSGGRGPRR